MDEHSETSKLPSSREKGIEDKKHCEEKQIAGIPNADKTLQDFANLRLDESSMPSTSGKIQKIPRKTLRESDDLDASKKSRWDVQYSPYTVIKKRECGRTSDMSKLQDLAPSVPVIDAEGRDSKGESSVVGSTKSKGGLEKSPERQIFEFEISDKCTESISYDSRRKNRKRKSNPTTTEIPDDLEEPSTSEKASDIEIESSGHKRRKSEDHATQNTSENVSELEETKTPLKIILTPVREKDGSLNYSIKKSTMDEPSARKITRRRAEVPNQTIGSKISSTIDEEFGKSPDPAKPSSENLVLSKKSNAETTHPVLADTKLEIRRLNIYQFLKLSEKEDQIFDEQCLETTMKVMTSEIERQVKSFFKQHLTNAHNTKHLLSNARKLENSLAKINDILWDIPKLNLQDNDNVDGKTLLDLLIYLKNGPIRRAIMGEAFDLNKIDEVQLMKKYDAYVQRWMITVNYYETNRDNVYKKIELLKTILKEVIENCEEGKKFIEQLKKSQFLRDVAVLERSLQIGEDLTRPSHVGYNVPDSYLEKIKDAYLHPIPCTDELHALHHQRGASSSNMHLSLNESRDCQPLSSFGYSPKDFENVEKASREFLQKDSSDENEIDKFQGKELSGLGLDPNTPKNSPGQLLINSSDVQQSSTDPSNQLTQTMGSSGVQETLTDTTSQPKPSISMSGIERSSTDTEYEHFHPTSVIVSNRNIQQSSTDTGSVLFQLLMDSNDGKKQTDTNSKLIQPLGSTDVQRFSSDPNRPITPFGEKIKMSSSPDTLVQSSQKLKEHEARASDSKDQNESEDKISRDTDNCEPLDLGSSADDQIIELSEQKPVINPESNPIKISEVLSDAPRNQITSTPIKRADGREHMDSREQLEDSPSEIEYSPSEIEYSTSESPENFSVGSSCDSEFVVCNKSMEIDEMNDQLSLLVYEIEEFGKNLSNIVKETQDAIKKLVDSKEKINLNLMQFLKTKISGLLKKK